ncbi:hypothetical protein FRC00_008445 [Tulasnella sp. 408]|nr:hypothetical protein FRC00_008445 [Tulasnella sp. 408]
MEPLSFDLSPAFEYVDDIKLPLTELGPSFSSAPKFSQRIIPPTTYQLQHDGCSNNARVWALPPSVSVKDPQRKSSSLITDASPTFNPIAAMLRSSGSGSKDELGGGKFHVIDPVETPPTHCIRKVTGRTYALFEGPGDHDEHPNARKIMDFQTESRSKSVSTYTQTDGASQHAMMQRVEGLNPWWSIEVSGHSTESDPTALKQALLEDPIRFCVERYADNLWHSSYLSRSIFSRGIAAISPSAHGEVLGEILTAMYRNTSVPIQECSERKLLNRYIHCFCIGKIRKRLAAPILGGSHGGPSVILDQKRFGFVTRKQF